MAGLPSPLRLAPLTTPLRAPSPAMSPGGRRGRLHAGSEEGRLRDLSPDTTLRAFTHRPVPFDTSCDAYRIFACIDALTPAERDLGARVAKAAQRLKSWCAELDQWPWPATFEPPADDFREQRRRSLERRIREHVGDAHGGDALPPLEYWGSLLSVEVEAHEARLDDIDDELLRLDVDELKDYVLDMHPAARSRPASAGYEAARHDYKPMDDFSFLITQTLLSALPHHAQLKDRLGTWTARISILRQVPRYLDDLATAHNAMRLGWDAIDPPADTSDAAFAHWKDAVDTISAVLSAKVRDLGKRLDAMLDNLEGRHDCIPDTWIDTFERLEADYGRWSHESRRKVMDFDLRRKYEHKSTATQGTDARAQPPPVHPEATATALPHHEHLDKSNASVPVAATYNNKTTMHGHGPQIASPASVTHHHHHHQIVSDSNIVHRELSYTPVNDAGFGSPRVQHLNTASSSNTSTPSKKPWFMTDAIASPASSVNTQDDRAATSPAMTSTTDGTTYLPGAEQTCTDAIPFEKVAQGDSDDESEFDEGDTVVHNDLEDSPEAAVPVQALPQTSDTEHEQTGEQVAKVMPWRRKPAALSDNPIIITNDGQDGAMPEPPHTPRSSRRDSESSVSSNVSLGDSSPPSYIEDSPLARDTTTNRSVRAPRPELNAAMAKRRIGRNTVEPRMESAPWPPTQFSQKSSVEDLERKISDILTTIPAHIRLTSGPGADSPEVRPSRGLATRASKPYLRATRSVSGLKSPELTLSPAKSEFDSIASGRKSAAMTRSDNDIKLYHLTQPGKEQPVKLFIRRVGENGERVMVRVGGGWADLGEYLRQYAEHHGRRTASDGKFEILGLEVKNNESANSPIRPDSAASRRDRRVSSARPIASPLTTPTKCAAGTTTASMIDAVPPMPNFSGIAEEAGVPSTSSSSRSWTGNEVGLAGPNARKLDLSGDKLEWIEGMMKQARTVSGSVLPPTQGPYQQREERADSTSESRPDSRTGSKKPEFGDLGKVGGTKRIFLRGGKPVME
ncbi:hypothetical protein ACEQ8H_005867 [Pleosporales sp. CAS-2024a]